MASRPCDFAIAAVALLPAAPICLIAAVGIWIADGRPVLHKTRRVGRGGRVFTMYKFRTMRVEGKKSPLTPPPPFSPRDEGARAAARRDRSGTAADAAIRDAACPRVRASAAAGPSSPITAHRDSRVFGFGAFLRKWKVDELPQIANVLIGDMSIVGPRPEDPAIVEAWYGALARETLRVRPGLASPGSIYNFTHGEPELDARAAPGEDTASTYARWLLPRKLALDLVYVREASFAADLRIMLRAALAIAARGLGRHSFPDPPEMTRALRLEDDLRKPRPRLAGLS